MSINFLTNCLPQKRLSNKLFILDPTRMKVKREKEVARLDKVINLAKHPRLLVNYRSIVIKVINIHMEKWKLLHLPLECKLEMQMKMIEIRSSMERFIAQYSKVE